eukprot:Gregarina_sp_Poly_1__5154@NODE_272_length_10257_cov_229_971246_g237_i0_p7_GENE_NODE_272_length_10257_cov_229_971246_g237_i0NODE_272_length_10257_cov_229_971246_g237_i0_p7_ORF_typecomplete_len188_score13_20_NODE_272_length_10257_cov_229_971246_g237_i013921955
MFFCGLMNKMSFLVFRELPLGFKDFKDFALQGSKKFQIFQSVQIFCLILELDLIVNMPFELSRGHGSSISIHSSGKSPLSTHMFYACSSFLIGFLFCFQILAPKAHFEIETSDSFWPLSFSVILELCCIWLLGLSDCFFLSFRRASEGVIEHPSHKIILCAFWHYDVMAGRSSGNPFTFPGFFEILF